MLVIIIKSKRPYQPFCRHLDVVDLHPPVPFCLSRLRRVVVPRRGISDIMNAPAYDFVYHTWPMLPYSNNDELLD
ncbi:hypothetical protein SCLCIDRAFT_1129188 [Scleroderma citrinum Foug A]|uniref:Uncharacterized protein n=1 Tax=Scleroderma citrinum Foug A TaxID=1036808 RepID=A0A0C3DN34_9AGAM|nr:hypothetical protein SCLCIDRAFT_1129188 [Scleroderma citrinum Foug A]